MRVASFASSTLTEKLAVWPFFRPMTCSSKAAGNMPEPMRHMRDSLDSALTSSPFSSVAAILRSA